MNRSLIIMMGALALGAALFGSSYVVSQRLCQVCVAQPAGGLDWLRKEYYLNDGEMARIQKQQAKLSIAVRHDVPDGRRQKAGAPQRP